MSEAKHRRRQKGQDDKTAVKTPTIEVESPQSDVSPTETIAATTNTEAMPATTNNLGIRQKGVIRLQKRHGNNFVQRRLAKKGRLSNGSSVARKAAGARENGSGHGTAEASGLEGLEGQGSNGSKTFTPVPPAGPGSNGDEGPQANGDQAGLANPEILPRMIQREDEADDTPTEKEKRQALAKAAAKEGQASQAKSKSVGTKSQAKGKATAQKQKGQAAMQAAQAAKSKGAAGAAKGPGGDKPVSQQGQIAAKAGAAGGAGNGQAPSGALSGAMAGAAMGGGGKAPNSPEEDPAFQSVQGGAKQIGTTAKVHEPAGQKASQAQGAAVPPANEVTSKAQDKQMGKMDGAPAPPFNKAAFKAKLMAKIQQLSPKSASEMDSFKGSGKMAGVKGEMKGEVSEQKKQTAEPTEKTAQEPPDPSGIPPKQVTPLQPNQAGLRPKLANAKEAVPKQKGQSEIESPVQQESKSLDEQMKEAEITEEQLKKGNEPEFESALDAKKEAQTHAKEAPKKYREEEKEKIGEAKQDAQQTADEKLQGMHGDKEQLLGQITQDQGATKGKDEGKRKQVADKIQSIYDKTKTKVEQILSKLESKVNAAFDAGAESARRAFEDFVDAKTEAFKQRRYGGMFGWAKWLKDKVLWPPPELNAIFNQGKQEWISAMDAVIDDVATAVSEGVSQAKEAIAQGKQEIQTYVAGLPEELQQVGQEAAQDIQDKFSQLESKVDQATDSLINNLAQKYNEKLNEINARVEQLKEENKGLVQKAGDAIKGAIDTIMKIKDMLMNVLASAASAIKKIIKDPIGFLGNLLSAVKSGFMNFVGNIGKHLKKGLMSWLFGAVGKAGIKLPKSFDLKGIFMLVMQLLGLTWENIRGRAVKLLGEKVVAALEKAFDIFMIIKDKGLAGLWEFIMDKLGDLKAMVMDQIKDMVITQVIQAGVKWLLGLLGGPAGAFVKAAMAIYDIVMWFINNGSRVITLVQAIIKSITSIASGNIGAAAAFIEQSLAKAIPIVISFLASLLGLGDIAEKVKGIIQTVQKPINKAIDWVIGKAKKVAKKIMGALGFGKGKEAEGGDSKESSKAIGKARTRVGKVTSGPLKDEADLRSKVGAIEKELKPEGLKSLSVKPKENKPGQFDVIARQTEGTDVGDATVGGALQVDLSGKPKRPSWRTSTKKKLAEKYPQYHITGTTNLKTDDEGQTLYDRRHKVAYEHIKETIIAEINGKSLEEAAKIMTNKGYAPSGATSAAIHDALWEYLKDKFNDPANLWVGGSKVNQEKGREIGVEAGKLKRLDPEHDKAEYDAAADKLAKASVDVGRGSSKGKPITASEEKMLLDIDLIEGRMETYITRITRARRNMAKADLNRLNAVIGHLSKVVKERLTKDAAKIRRGLEKAVKHSRRLTNLLN